MQHLRSFSPSLIPVSAFFKLNVTKSMLLSLVLQSTFHGLGESVCWPDSVKCVLFQLCVHDDSHFTFISRQRSTFFMPVLSFSSHTTPDNLWLSKSLSHLTVRSKIPDCLCTVSLSGSQDLSLTCLSSPSLWLPKNSDSLP